MIAAYLFKMISCSLLFYILYVIGLENENMNRFKRFYLISSIILSLLIPLCSINIPSPIENIESGLVSTEQFIQDTIFMDNPEGNINNPEDASVSINIPLYIAAAYIMISCVFLFIFWRNLLSLLLKDDTSCTYFRGIKVVLLSNKIVPHSFGNKIFVSVQSYYNNIPEEILIHESEHIRQKHTWDNIFIEFVLCFFWFNPVFYLYRNKIKLNHEFLADEAVLHANSDIAGYQTLLLNQIINNKRSIGLTSHFNFLTTKKRFIMMTKSTSKKKAICRKAAIIPVIILSVILFSGKSIANTDKTDDRIIAHTVIEVIIPGEGANEAQLKQYTDIVNGYAEITDGEITGWKNRDVSNSDIDKLYPIYVQMNKEQRQSQSMHLVGPFTAFKLRGPNMHEWQSCKNVSSIRIDDAKSSLSEVDNYKRQDFVFFIKYANKETGLKESALWTKQGYENYMNKYQNGISLEKLLETRPQVWFKRFKK